MFGKHALAAKILQEAKDQGITLAVARPIDDTEYKYGSGGVSLSILDEGHEDVPIVSPAMVPKLTNMTAEEYLNRSEQLHISAEKMARDSEMVERAEARFRKFELTEKGIASALKYISSMMPKHYELSTDGKVLNFTLPTRYGMVKRMEYVIEDLKSGFSSSHPFTIIDNMICIPSNHPRWIKGAFEFQLKQHLDYELRFKNIFIKKENENV